jgi:hypothetical protein
MGNTFAKEKEINSNNEINKKYSNDSDTINWNSIKTEKIPNKNVGGDLSNDSKLLLGRLELNLPKNEETEQFSEVDNIFSKYQKTSPEKKEPALSETSPFISSEMYNLLMKPEQTNTQTQQGGGKIEGDDSSTSETSSSSNMDDVDSSSEKKKHKKSKKIIHKNKNKKNFKNKVVETTPEDSSSSESSEVLSTEASDVLEGTAASDETTEKTKSDELDYVSSSAHTEGQSETEKKDKKKKTKKEEVTELSGGYNSTDDYVSSVPASANETTTIKNLNNNLPHSSINTSEINMITEDY